MREKATVACESDLLSRAWAMRAVAGLRELRPCGLLVPQAEPTDGYVFALESEVLLKDGEADVVVQPMTGLGRVLPEGLKMAAILHRMDPRLCVVGAGLARLPDGSTVACVSGHCRGLVRAARAGLHPAESKKGSSGALAAVDAGNAAAAVVVLGELELLGRAGEAKEVYEAEAFVPPPGAGLAALVVRDGDRDAEDLCLKAGDPTAMLAWRAETEALGELDAKGRHPAGALATVSGEAVLVDLVVAHPSGAPILRARTRGSVDQANEVARTAARNLLAQGAADILASVLRGEA